MLSSSTRRLGEGGSVQGPSVLFHFWVCRQGSTFLKVMWVATENQKLNGTQSPVMKRQETEQALEWLEINEYF